MYEILGLNLVSFWGFSYLLMQCKNKMKQLKHLGEGKWGWQLGEHMVGGGGGGGREVVIGENQWIVRNF